MSDVLVGWLVGCKDVGSLVKLVGWMVIWLVVWSVGQLEDLDCAVEGLEYVWVSYMRRVLNQPVECVA